MTGDTTLANFCFGIVNGRGKRQGLRDDSVTSLVFLELLSLQLSVILEPWISVCDECEFAAVKVDEHCRSPSAQSTSPAITILRSPNLRETMLQNRPFRSDVSGVVHASSKQCLRS